MARNTGVAACDSSWVGFLDDDAVPAADWLDQALATIDRVTDDVSLVAGRVLPAWPQHTAGLADPERLGRRWKACLSLVEEEHWLPLCKHPLFVGCNMLLRRESLVREGGFPTHLGRTPTSLVGGEEYAVAARFVERGERVVFEPKLSVFHTIHAERLTGPWIRRRARAEGELVSKTRCSAAQTAKSVMALGPLTTMTVLEWARGGYRDNYVRLWHNLGYLDHRTAEALRRLRLNRNRRS